MADVPSTLAGWSTTTASNSPTDLTTIGSGLADNLQEIQGVVRRGLAHLGANIASATTTDIGAIDGLSHTVTGTTTITGLGTVAAGIWKVLIFEGALTFTHNGTSLILPGGANITTAAGDVAVLQSLGSGNWRCWTYTRASGLPVINPDVMGPFTSRSSDTILAVADVGKVISATSAYTQTFTAAATLGDNWFVTFINSSSGLLVLDPNSSETIDGQTTLSLLPGERVTVFCTGSAFRTTLRTFNEESLDKFILQESRSGNAMTLTLLNRLGLTPSVEIPVLLDMRSTTATSGDRGIVAITSALSVTVSSGSKIGTVDTVPYRIYAYVLDPSSPVLAVYNPIQFLNDNTSTAGLRGVADEDLVNATAEGGAGLADTFGTFYASSAKTSVAAKAVGYVEGSQTTAGTWSSAPTKVHSLRPGDRRTGDIVSTYVDREGTFASGGSGAGFPYDDTTPQSSEGFLVFSLAYTPRSTANLLRVRSLVHAITDGGGQAIAAIFSSAHGTDALVASTARATSTTTIAQVTSQVDFVAQYSSTTITLRLGSADDGLMYVNGYNGNAVFNTHCNTFFEITEVFT